MANENPKRPWEERLHEAGARMEEDMRDFVRYFNDEVVPDLRKNGSDALRAAARELNRMAQRMDERAGRTPPSGTEGAPKP
jgi:GAF domain-containing protein